MILPILISASVAPGSYFFCALAGLATAHARSPASAKDLAWLKTRWCIIVLPDVLAEAQASLCGAAWRALGLNAGAVCTIEMALPPTACCYFYETKDPCVGSNSSAATSARTIKCSAREPGIMEKSSDEGLGRESCPEGALVYRKPSR